VQCNICLEISVKIQNTRKGVFCILTELFIFERFKNSPKEILMKQQLLKIIASLTVWLMYSSLSAQVYLDYAKIHDNIVPMGGYNMEQITNGDYFVVDNYPHYQADMDPDEVNKVQVYTSYLSAGLYIAKYNKNGKYLKHTFIRGGASASHEVALATNDSFIAIMGQFYNDAWFYGADSGIFVSKPLFNNYIVKYSLNLDLLEVLVLPNDSVYFDKIKYAPNGDLIVYGANSGNVPLTIKDKSFEIKRNNATRMPNTNDIFLLKLNTDLEYVEHNTFGILGTEVFNQMEINKKGQIFLSGYASFRNKSVIMGDTIQMSDNFGYGTSPLILKFDNGLQLVDYYINDLLTSNNVTRISSGNILMACHAKLSSQAYGYYLVLMDSNFNEKGRLLRSGGGSATNTLGNFYGFEYADGNFGVAISDGIFYFKDSNVVLNGNSIMVLDKDSLKLIKKFTINSPMKKIFHIDSQNILSTIEFNGEISFQNGPTNSPPFAMGDRLYPTQPHTAILNHRYDCTPVTTYLEHDSQINCSDQYLMKEGRGNVRLIHKGSGASFQWYSASDTTFKLSDQESPIQGGQYWKGTKTSYYRYGLGTNSFISDRLIAKVGGSCTEPYWSDTATQIIWGAPRMFSTESTKNVVQGGSDSIEAYLSDKNYPLDSIEFQWYRGATALIDGFRFQGARTQKLYINNIKDFDQGVFSCAAFRIHCRDWSSVLASSTFVNVKITGVKEIENSNIAIYPNPTNGMLNIQADLSTPIKKIEIYDAVGRLQKVVNNVSSTINVMDLTTGLFTLKIITENSIYTTQFIKN